VDKTGIIVDIYDAAINIDIGKKGFAASGKEQEGRISYEDGLTKALCCFKKVQDSEDPYTIMLAEYTFISQELEICNELDKTTLRSLIKAVHSFNDAFLALKVVENAALYQGADKTHPHTKKHRIHGYPKDSFHIACISHKIRLKNTLRSPGIDHVEKALLKQRVANLSTAQKEYIEKQKKALGI